MYKIMENLVNLNLRYHHLLGLRPIRETILRIWELSSIRVIVESIILRKISQRLTFLMELLIRTTIWVFRTSKSTHQQ